VEATEALLTEGGMQWAYSELFQNYSGAQISGYLEHTWKQSRRVGVLVHYSETHDNDRLAAKGRAWSLLRNRSAPSPVSAAALVSPAGSSGWPRKRSRFMAMPDSPGAVPRTLFPSWPRLTAC